jgi:Ser/Thr protein kinase RdoA (MazF antagonist)
VQAFQAAKAFGEFQKHLVDLPGKRLCETIPDFHNTPKRFEAFEKALNADSQNRAKSAKAEIEFAIKHKDVSSLLLSLCKEGKIPERITHNDTKLNNVLLDDKTGEAVCVIDLDTVMPGLALYDFGDLVRTSTSPAAEDEKDLGKVKMQMHMYKALVEGYMSTAKDFLTKTEIGHLAFSGKLITLEIGLRFLTDYLSGDTYFKIHRDGHNIDRCRTQFKLVSLIEEQEEEMNRIADKI